ncbi:MAG: potassium channel family protein [Mycobacterium sp.]|nr:potassium channel family protein [Mycobacterium sp.]
MRVDAVSDDLAAKPDSALVDYLYIPQKFVSPGRRIAIRFLYALMALFAAVIIVYIDRDGYRDATGKPLTFLDCVYYATVSLSTTGYGDITPIAEHSRLINVLVITPLRVAFLIVLVGTTVETLTSASRQALKIQRWRNSVQDHTVVVGYGTKGRAAVKAMLGDGVKPSDICVVDTDADLVQQAKDANIPAVKGDANKSSILRLALAHRAKAIVVATDSDPTAVLVTLTAHELAPNATIIVSVRESENRHLLEQSGADQVVVSSENAGRLLGLATSKPKVVEMIEDLLTPHQGFAIAERPVEPREIGGSPRHLPDIVLGVVRGDSLFRRDAPEVDTLEKADRLLYVRSTTGD